MYYLENSLQDAKVLANVFSKKILLDLASDNGISYKLNDIIQKTGINRHPNVSNFSDIFEASYTSLLNQYRNEYVYKNAIASKIVKGRHRLSKISYFTEFKSRNTIADCVVANGTTTAYEIKTEYDSFARLDNQLTTYRQTFDNVIVVIPESKLESAIDSISLDVGILVLTDTYTFSEYRSPTSQLDNLSHDLVFDCLHKREYESITLKYFDILPNVKPVFIRRECKKLFCELPIAIAHKEFLSCLRKRKTDILCKQLADNLPDSLLSLGITLNLKNYEYQNLVENLSKTC